MLGLGLLSEMMVRIGSGLDIHHGDKVLAVLGLGSLSEMMVRVGLGLHIHHGDKV